VAVQPTPDGEVRFAASMLVRIHSQALGNEAARAVAGPRDAGQVGLVPLHHRLV
jgi:hypothetical protein